MYHKDPSSNSTARGQAVQPGVSLQHTTKFRERFEQLNNPNATDVIPAIASAVKDPSPAGDATSTEQRACDAARHIDTRSPDCWNEKRCGGQSGVFVSKESSHTTSSSIPNPAAARCRDGDSASARARCQKMRWRSMRCVKRLLIRPTWTRFLAQLVSFMITTLVRILDRDATIAGIRAALTQVQEFGVSEWKRKSEKPPNEKVISTKMFHKAKGDEVRSRIVAREHADGVFAPEHHAGTPPTWALKLVISTMMSKGRTRQLASHDVSVAFFHTWLERGVWVKPPKDLRLSDDWLWYVVKALYGMKESNKAFQGVVREMYITYEWTLLQTVPCLAYCGRLDFLAGRHGDDFYTESEPGALDEVDEMSSALFPSNCRITIQGFHQCSDHKTHRLRRKTLPCQADQQSPSHP